MTMKNLCFLFAFAFLSVSPGMASKPFLRKSRNNHTVVTEQVDSSETFPLMRENKQPNSTESHAYGDDSNSSRLNIELIDQDNTTQQNITWPANATSDEQDLGSTNITANDPVVTSNESTTDPSMRVHASSSPPFWLDLLFICICLLVAAMIVWFFFGCIRHYTDRCKRTANDDNDTENNIKNNKDKDNNNNGNGSNVGGMREIELDDIKKCPCIYDNDTTPVPCMFYRDYCNKRGMEDNIEEGESKA